MSTLKLDKQIHGLNDVNSTKENLNVCCESDTSIVCGGFHQTENILSNGDGVTEPTMYYFKCHL